MSAFDTAWSVLKMRFQDLKRENKYALAHERGRQKERDRYIDGNIISGQLKPQSQLIQERINYLSSLPQTQGAVVYPPPIDDETKQDIMSYLVRQQMNKNKEAGKIADDAKDAFGFAGM